jgi:hypothetical protein
MHHNLMAIPAFERGGALSEERFRHHGQGIDLASRSIDAPFNIRHIARQSGWPSRVNQDDKGSRGVWIMRLLIDAGKR